MPRSVLSIAAHFLLHKSASGLGYTYPVIQTSATPGPVFMPIPTFGLRRTTGGLRWSERKPRPSCAIV
jgi:hypothetical protein